MDCQDYSTIQQERKKGRTAFRFRGTRCHKSVKEARIRGTSHIQSNRVRPKHCYKRAETRHTAPKEQKRESPWLLPQSGSGGLQGPQSEQPETP